MSTEPEVIICGDTIKVRPRGALARRMQQAKLDRLRAEAEAYRKVRLEQTRFPLSDEAWQALRQADSLGKMQDT